MKNYTWLLNFRTVCQIVIVLDVIGVAAYLIQLNPARLDWIAIVMVVASGLFTLFLSLAIYDGIELLVDFNDAQCKANELINTRLRAIEEKLKL